MIAERIPELQHLSAEVKLTLAEELWQQASNEPFPVRQDHVQLLRDRLEQSRLNQEEGEPWEVVKARILGSR